MRKAKEVVDEQLAAASGVGLLTLLALPGAICLLAEVVVQAGWSPVWVLLLVTNIPLTVLRLWKAWYPYSFLGAVTPAIAVTEDQLRILSFLTSGETRRSILIAGFIPGSVLVGGIWILQAFGIVTVGTLLPGSLLRSGATLGQQLVLPWLLYALSVGFCLVGWPFGWASWHWERVVRTYPVYPLARFRHDFLAARAARSGIAVPRRAPKTPRRNPVLTLASTPLRWSQALGAALVIIGVPALYQSLVTLACNGGRI